MTEVSEGWLNWMMQALEVGRSPFALLQEMQKAGMDALQSQQMIAQAFHSYMLQNKPADLAATHYQYGASHIAAGSCVQLPDRAVPVAFRMAQPDIVLLHGFLTVEECEALIFHAVDRMTPSTVANLERGTREAHAARSSRGMHFQVAETPMIAAIEQRLAHLIGLPVTHGEAIQVLHYLPGQEYQPHFDFFPEHYQGSQAFLAGGGQRIATMLMYLNDVEAGGETIFPNLHLSVQPRQGSLLYFSYTNPLGQLDYHTLHGGAPVTQGEKWIATKWVRQHPRSHL